MGTYISPGGLIKKGEWENDTLFRESKDNTTVEDQDTLLQRLDEILEEERPEGETRDKTGQWDKTMPRFDGQHKWLI